MDTKSFHGGNGVWIILMYACASESSVLVQLWRYLIMSNISIFELEKKILKAQNPSEIDAITEEMDNQQLRDMIKLLIDRLTPENIKINRILNS